MNINFKKFIVDILMFLDFVVVAVSGFILWFILPRGNQKIFKSFIFLREEWIFIHDWASVLLIIFLLAHFFLNWNWIRAMFRNYFSKVF